MQYHIQEAAFELPSDGFIDRSVNVLIFGDPALPFNVVVTRDYFDEGSGIEALLQEQLRALSTVGKSYKQLDMSRARLPLHGPAGEPPANETAAPNAVGASVSYSKQGHTLYQRIVLIELPERKALVLTGTHAAPWKPHHEAQWASILQSVRVRPQ
ncbi:DUF1795 domain-containing protein [Acidovorax sp. SUPP950]|uniref:DcrB-related protein n=1 Tax=unclassified Acidovorax TaxID=2684926 RepID=UPI0023D1F3CC|nr:MULTISPECIES: DcrB-related protein [unclassified Acidovorax]GKS77910.1 DUF1795 domain-containing protein [Acidovorax sp. SUPP950]GKS97603.1 DUF1795 domain-containing protein [Acidovorax sp. SUPP2825]